MNIEYFYCRVCGDRLPLEAQSVLDDEENVCQDCSSCVHYKNKEEMVTDLVNGGYDRDYATNAANELFDD